MKTKPEGDVGLIEEGFQRALRWPYPHRQVWDIGTPSYVRVASAKATRIENSVISLRDVTSGFPHQVRDKPRYPPPLRACLLEVTECYSPVLASLALRQ